MAGSPQAPDAPERFAAERWFLQHGLPAVLRPGALVRRLLPRSAPALAAFAVVMASSAFTVAVTGKHTVDIDGTPTRSEWFVLAVVILVLPVAAAVGWLVSRITALQRRTLAAAVSLVVAFVGALFGGPGPRVLTGLVLEGIVVGLIFLCTATGVGSVLGLAVRVTADNLAMAGNLFTRALPILLLTFLVFFNSPVWLMASIVSRRRLWLALLFLFLIASAFLLTSTLERIGPTLKSSAKCSDDDAHLAGTPFEAMPDRPRRVPLTRRERSNIVVVVAISQLIQVLTIACVTAAIFFVLGLILLSPELLAAWTHGGSASGEFLGMTFPVPQALIQIALFLTALTFMYLSARAVSDQEYRAMFHDPLIEDLRLTLVARDRYRTATATV